MIRRFYILLLVLSLTAVSSWAVPKNEEYTRLARLSYIEGNASYQHSADVDWSAASVNLPLEPGDRIYTGFDGRAEIEFDDGSIYRLARNTDIEIVSLREDRIQIRVLVGLSMLMVASDTDFEINSPAAAFTTLKKGMYRFGVDENGDSDAVVRKGELEAANNNFSRRIQAGEMVRIAMGDADKPEYARYDNRDAWDEWNDRRNADMNAYAGKRYLPDNVYIGVNDLYQHGRWINVDNYGLAWVPYGISVSWVPYSTGRWCYRPFYGWTWISYEPWGWLPYHYGRWYRSSIHGWCWLPGPAFAFNFWSPALVTFYSGPGWVSWCPLGPGDYYNLGHYHYNHGIYGYQLAQLRGLHWRIPGNTYYRGDRHAFRTVNVDQFRNGSFGERGHETKWRDIDQPWRQGEVVRDRLPIQPTTTSFRPAPDRQARGPARIAQPLPAVVRNSPAPNLRGQEQFRRITNPEVPALPSRAERQLMGPQRGSPQAIESRPNARVPEAAHGAYANPDVQNQTGNTSSGQEGRKATTYRWVGTTESNREGTSTGENSVPAVRIENNRSVQPRSPAGVISERAVPEQSKAHESSSRVSPRIEEYHRPNSSTEQQTGTTERWSNRGSASTETPPAEKPRIYSAPRSERAPSSAPREDRTPSYTAPRVESAPSPGAPRVERTPEPAAPRRSSSSIDRDSGPRTYSAPSPSKGGGNPGSSSGSGSSSSSPAPSGGGEAHGHDRR